jgi:hypothetical protein
LLNYFITVWRYDENGDSSMTLSLGDNVKYENRLYKARGVSSRVADPYPDPHGSALI